MVIRLLSSATSPAGINLPVAMYLLYIMTVRPAAMTSDVKVAGLHSLPCTQNVDLDQMT